MTGTRIPIFCGAAMVLIVLPMLITSVSEESLLWSIRRSVDVAFPLFFLAFSAAALYRFAPGHFSAWALRNRRYLGIAFGVAFFTHAGLLLVRALLYPEPFLSEQEPARIVPGALGYLFAVVMVMTSNDGAVRLLGRRAWSVLHTTGGYLLTFLFAGVYLPAWNQPFFAPFAAAAAVMILLRISHALVRTWPRRTEAS